MFKFFVYPILCCSILYPLQAIDQTGFTTALSDVADSYFKEGLKYYQKGSIQQAELPLQSSALYGNVQALTLLGKISEKNRAQEKDPAKQRILRLKSLKWLKEAAQKGDRDAQFSVGFLFFIESITQTDALKKKVLYDRALVWLKHAAQRQDIRAKNLLRTIEAAFSGNRKGQKILARVLKKQSTYETNSKRRRILVQQATAWLDKGTGSSQDKK